MKFCASCGVQLEDTANVCTVCGAQQPSLEPQMASDFVYPVEEPLKKKHGKVVLLVVLFFFLGTAAIAVLGYFTGCFGILSPVDRIALAAKRTMLADNFTASIEYEYTYESATDTQELDLRYVVDKGKENLTLFYESDYATSLIHEDGRYYVDDDDYGYTGDIDTDEFFETYNQLSGKEEQEEIDWDDLIEDADLEEYVKGDAMEDFLEEFYDELLDDSKWQKNTLGLKKDGNTYTFTPNIQKTYDDVVALAKDKGVMTSELKDNIKYYEEDIEETIQDIDDLAISFTLKGRYLSQIVVEVTYQKYTVRYTIDFSDVNETQISKKEIEDFIDQAEELEEKDKCPTCGTRRYGSDHCWKCEEQCDNCYTYYNSDSMTYHRSSYYCNSCCTEQCRSCGKWLPPNVMVYISYYGYYQCYDCYYNYY